MDPYVNGYTGRGSVPNRNHKYQSPGFGKHHGPQYAQQQAQKYQKGPPNAQEYDNTNGRKHAYSVDQQHKMRNPPNPHYMRQQQNPNANQNQHQQQQQQQRRHYQDPNNYAQMQKHQQQQYPPQQQAQQAQQPHRRPPRNKKNRAANSPTAEEVNQGAFFDPAAASRRNAPNPQNQRRHRAIATNENQNATTNPRRRRTKQSVPNVSHSNDRYIAAPHNHNQRAHHSSTPNANNNRDRDRDRGQSSRRRKKSAQEDANRQHRKTKQRGDREARKRSKSRQHPNDTQQQQQQQQHRVEKARRTRKGSKNPDANQQLRDDTKDKKRRHTTAPRQQRKHSKSPNPERQRRHRDRNKSKKKKTKASAAAHHPSMGDVSGPNQSPYDRLNKGELAKKYRILDKLGRGNFSVVRRVERRIDQKIFAAKIISTRTMSQEEIDETHDEVDILVKLNHPNIVRLVDYIATPRHLYIVLELLNGGELFERLQKKKRFNEQMAAHITKQIADALTYMHSKGIVHRDLKPENILYESENDDAKIKISDFGLSRDTRSGRPLKTSCGTPGYVAPEIIRQQAYDETVDLWATGVIMYILLCGYPPFIGAGVDTQQSMFRKIKSGKYTYPKRDWNKVSACATDCIDSLLCVNPKDRMSAKELLAHPWIKQAQINNENEFMMDHFQSNLSNYLHKKRFRRGVRLIITLNRMLRGAGLEPIARQQRQQFRIRLKQYKEQLKDEQRKIYNKQQQIQMRRFDSDYDDEYMGYTIIDPDVTPAIDYSKV